MSLGLSREAPRTVRSIGPPKRTGSLLSANEAVTGPGAQTGKEGGREGNSKGGRGGGEDGETVSAASTAAAASLLPGKSRPLRRPAPQRKDSTSLRHRLHYPPVKGLANRSAVPADCPPLPHLLKGEGEPLTFSTPLLAGSVPNSTPPIGDELLNPTPKPQHYWREQGSYSRLIGGLHISRPVPSQPQAQQVSSRPRRSSHWKATPSSPAALGR